MLASGALASPEVRAFDCGRIELGGRTRRFGCIASVGFDSEVNRQGILAGRKASAMTLLDDDTITSRLTTLDWDRDGDEIVKVAQRKDFAGALGYVNAVGGLAEAMGHHPDIDIRWNTVTLRLATHSEGGLTDTDFELAGRIDALG